MQPLHNHTSVLLCTYWRSRHFSGFDTILPHPFPNEYGSPFLSGFQKENLRFYAQILLLATTVTQRLSPLTM